MATVYNVSVTPGKKENDFTITWLNKKTNKEDSFEQSAPEFSGDGLEVGKILFHFLDGDGRHLTRALDEAAKAGESLQLYLHACQETADWPFELLAHEGSFLLPYKIHLVRSVSDWGRAKIQPAKNRPLKLLFMACSALDVQPELDFEKEEESIFKVTEKLAVDMEVEDSGSLEGLKEQLEQTQYDVVHLSGHASINEEGVPFFVMEDETGYRRDVFPEELWKNALIENPPRLLFLSGCRTGETPKREEKEVKEENKENRAAVSFARLLVENYHVPAVLGWGRSVSDVQATHAEQMIYHELSRGRSILDAVQRARNELIERFQSSPSPAWPLLRLFSSGEALDAIVKTGQKVKTKPRRMKHVYLEQSQVKVLIEGFVGRRRQLQQSLRAIKQDYNKVGVLLQGTGGLGKSCLAGKISERHKNHTLIIVHGRLDSITLEAALMDAFIKARDEEGKKILAEKKELTEKLPDLCAGSFKEKNYLVLLDDFEQNLEGAEQGQPGAIMSEAVELVRVLLHCLPFSEKETQVIFTSRYLFSLTEQGRDLVEVRLELVSITSFREPEQLKKVRELEHILDYPEVSLIPRMLAAGRGNPRLMEWLDVLIGEMTKAEVPELLAAIKDKQEVFIRDHVIRELLQRGGKDLTLFLHWFSIYRRPVLLEGVQGIGEKAGLDGWQELLEQGLRLSLVEHDQARGSFEVTPLLREELFKDLEEGQRQSCHEAAFYYYKSSCEGKSEDQFDPIGVEEWIYHALGCGEEEVASRQGVILIDYMYEHMAFWESRRVGLWILKKKKQELSTEHDAFLLNELGCTIHTIGDHRQAIEYCQQALDIDRAVFGEEHPNVARDLNNLGPAWRALGEPRKAITYYEQALNIRKKVYGEEHPEEVATLLNNLGASWDDLGAYQKAIDYYEQALNILKKVYGEKHRNVAATLNNLGETWRALGEPRKAIKYYEQALNITKKVYGEKHPNVATTLNNLGLAWGNLGEHLTAIDYYEQALNIDRSVFGDEHPYVARDLNKLGGAWRALGEPRKAINYNEKALSIWKGVHGEKHQDVATALTNLGSAWKDLGEYQKAIDYYQQALTIVKAAFGEKHKDVAAALINLGAAWKDLGEYQKAIEYNEKALSVDRSVFGEEHPNVATALNNLGTAWDDLGEYQKAIEYYQHALNIRKKVYGTKHPDVATTLNNLGGVWVNLGEYQKAIRYYKQALDILKKFYGEKHPDVATTLNNLGGAWIYLGEHKKAIEYIEKAFSIWKKVYGIEHPNVAATLSNLGGAWGNLGEHQTAIEYYQQALDISRAVFGEEHPNVARDLNNLGGVWSALGEPRKAIEYFQQAMSIDGAVFGEVHPNVARDLNNLGTAYFAQGKKKTAKGYFEQAYAMFKNFFGEDHPDTKTVAGWLKACEDGA